MSNGERSHTTTFTESGANLYTIDTIIGRGCENRTHSSWVKAKYLLQSIYPQSILAYHLGLEPRMLILEIRVLPITLVIDYLVPLEGNAPSSFDYQSSSLLLSYRGIKWWSLKESNLTAATLHIMASDLQSPAGNKLHIL